MKRLAPPKSFLASTLKLPERMRPVVDFAIVYENKARELESVLHVRRLLEIRGYAVRLLQFPFETSRVRRFQRVRTRVVVVPSAYDNHTLYIMAHQACRGFKYVVNMQWEQIFTVGDEEKSEHYHLPRESARSVMHACWGEKPKEALIRAGIDKDLVEVTGPPHFDFLRPEFEGFYVSRSTLMGQYGMPVERKMILFISSFSWSFLSKDEFIDASSRLGGDRANRSRSFAVESQAAILDWVCRFLQDHPDYVFVYRPHPSESTVDRLHTMASEFDNFYVISDYSVKQWVRVADIVTTWISTSIAEVFYSGRNCLILRPVEAPEDLEVALMRNADTVRSYDDFQSSVSSPGRFPLRRELLDSYYDVSQSETSASRFVQLLVRAREGELPAYSPTRADREYFRSRIRSERIAQLRGVKRSVRSVVSRIVLSSEKLVPLSGEVVVGSFEDLTPHFRKHEANKVSAADILDITMRLEKVSPK